MMYVQPERLWANRHSLSIIGQYIHINRARQSVPKETGIDKNGIMVMIDTWVQRCKGW